MAKKATANKKVAPQRAPKTAKVKKDTKKKRIPKAKTQKPKVTPLKIKKPKVDLSKKSKQSKKVTPATKNNKDKTKGTIVCPWSDVKGNHEVNIDISFGSKKSLKKDADVCGDILIAQCPVCHQFVQIDKLQMHLTKL